MHDLKGGKIKVNSQKAYTTVVLYRSRNLFGETCTSFFLKSLILTFFCRSHLTRPESLLFASPQYISTQSNCNNNADNYNEKISMLNMLLSSAFHKDQGRQNSIVCIYII